MNSFVLFRQRHKTSCGATAAAIVTSTPLDRAEAINGTGPTKAKKLAATLRALGADVPSSRLTRISRTVVPRRGDIVRIAWQKGTSRIPGHWTVYLGDGRFADPLFGIVDLAFYQKRGGKATSFLRIAHGTRAES